MSTSSGSFFSSVVEMLLRLFGGAPQPPVPPESGDLRLLAPRVLVLVYNPVVNPATGRRMIQELNWNDPDRLAGEYSADVDECSGGLVKYRIVERIELNEFVPKVGGANYTAAEYPSLYRNGGPWLAAPGDYAAILAQFDILNRVKNNELDEVWVFNYPGAGLWESTMAGRGAFYCNSEPRPNTSQCPRRFVIMGFSPERDVGEMHENLGHRAESILGRVFGAQTFLQWAYAPERTPLTAQSVRNDFERFLWFDQIAPGKANLGTVHYAPNSTTDYEWGRRASVLCCADDWLLYPHLPEPPNYRMMDSPDWGGGDIRAHHKWWFKHFPQAAGVTRGIANNWWKYVIQVDDPLFDRLGQVCGM